MCGYLILLRLIFKMTLLWFLVLGALGFEKKTSYKVYKFAHNGKNFKKKIEESNLNHL